ncbi:MAG TPA: diguanylate cyclase [Alkalispirochaeta sp.]|nr:diguanylate cyclase [Alkalispirochaeta sp.]
MVTRGLWILPTALVVLSCTPSGHEVSVTTGTMSVPSVLYSEARPLVGSWDVYPGEILRPDSEDIRMRHQHIPPTGGHYTTDDGARYVTGPVTHRMTITGVPRTPPLGIYIPPSSATTQAWINGESTDPFRNFSIVPLLPDRSGTVELVIVTNGYHYPREGLARTPPYVGPLSELLRMTGRRVFWDGLIVGVLLILAGYHVLLRLSRGSALTRTIPTVTLAAFLGLLAGRILLVEGTMILGSIPELGAEILLRLRGFVVYPLVALYLRFLSALFPGESPRSVSRWLQRASWGWLGLSLIVPGRWWMDALFAWLPIMVVALAVSVITLLRACRAGRNSAHLLSTALLVLVVGALVEAAGCAGWIAFGGTPIPLTAVVFGGLSSLALSRRVFEMRISLAHLREQANHDGLTNLYNRRTLDSKLEEEWARHIRSGESLAAIMIDIDFFKPYNDTWGHPAGDRVLKEVARTLTEHAQRSADVTARYGGEEFFLLLPSTTARAAYLIADRIRDAMHRNALPHPTTERGIVTVSAGVTAVIPEHDEHGPRGYPSLVAAADRALYDAKRGGRDTVRTASVEGAT